ncbi:rcc01693 family protein [Yoonia maritima]|uniref:rcc01693 family protein n=1 Tax=Yoonia maritima TaxID=1435347 RepID=UPI000D110DF6|nr:rcc01693 family protein [Yoonia maritima]
MIGLDWRGLMQAGLHGLRLTPDQFWALTPTELQIMLGLAQTSPPMGRDRLAELQTAFPDVDKENLDG